MSLIYKDKNLNNRIENNVLYENYTYFVDVSNINSHCIIQEIYKNSFENSIDYIPGNNVAKLRIKDYVGFIELFGQVYDLRTKKFINEDIGENQYAKIVEEINDQLNSLSFKYDTPTYYYKELSREKSSIATLIERFDYFKQITLDYPIGSNIETYLNLIINKPHKRSFNKNEIINSNKNGRVNIKQTIRKISTGKIKYFRDEYSETTFAEKVVSKHNLDYNTKENSFIKYFLEEIFNTCNLVATNYPNSKLYNDAMKMNHIIKKFLFNPIFKNIDKITYLPEYSTVLLSKAGYREMLLHYLYSKKSHFSIFSYAEKLKQKSGLKRISTVFELWAFLKVVNTLLNDRVEIIYPTYSIKEKNIDFGYSIKNGDYKVTYNRTFRKKHEETYSHNFRPDITIEANGKYYLLDAKFKNTIDIQEPENNNKIENIDFHFEDIDKMHCYLDAISNVAIALIMYPGNKFAFFEKEYNHLEIPIKNDIDKINNLNGVGAIPININNDYYLKAIMNLVKNDK